jgi:hypothetical protein
MMFSLMHELLENMTLLDIELKTFAMSNWKATLVGVKV